MREDTDLLREYAESRSERAFAELLHRHLGLVYSIALRQVNGDVHLAQDVSQETFIALAKKASALSHHPVLSAWLYRTTRYVAVDAIRREQRRKQREWDAQEMNLETHTSSEDRHQSLRPALDELIANLDERDRAALILRYYENRAFTDIGARLSMTENAARMRVERALDKLDGLLRARGLSSSSMTLATIVSQQAATATPAGLTAIVAGVVSASAPAATLPAVAAAFMSAGMLKGGIVATVGLAAVAALYFQHRANGHLVRDVERLQEEYRALVVVQAEVRKMELGRRQAQEEIERRTESARMQQEAALLAASQSAGDSAGVPRAIFEPTDVDVIPQPRSQPRPVFPKALRAWGISGEAKLSYVVDEGGKVQEVHVVSSTNPLFGTAAGEAIRGFTYSPAVKGGGAVAVRMETAILFNIGSPQSGPNSQHWFAP